MPSITGLTAAEVEARRAAGQTNQPPKSQTKTTGEIVRDNVCTYFNLVFLVLAVMLALVHSWLNMGFLGIVFWNTLIGIVQQLRAKRTIDKLTLVSAQKLRCLRDGRWCEVLSDDLVQDDVVEFGAGDQIVAVHFKGQNFKPDGTLYSTSLEDSCVDYKGGFEMLRALPQPLLPVLREEAVPARAASDIAFMKSFF